MSALRFRIHKPNEEQVKFFVGDTEVGFTDHDALGWEGMEFATKLFKRVAKECGAQVQHTEGGDE